MVTLVMLSLIGTAASADATLSKVSMRVKMIWWRFMSACESLLFDQTALS